MKALGFHLNLAPVVESLNDLNRFFLADRSYGSVRDAILFGTAAVNGYENSGIGAVLKHFPGNTNMDPHTGLPEIGLDRMRIETELVAPFSAVIRRTPSGILMSHARTTAFDPTVPACLSVYWVTDVLRKRENFTGLVFSDDIFMDALKDNGFPPEKAAVMAVEAGVDCIMLSEKRFAPVARIILRKMRTDPSFSEKVDEAVARVVRWKIRMGILAFCCDDKGQWSMAVPSPMSISNRLSDFRNARDENIRLYRDFFSLPVCSRKKKGR